MNRDSSQQHPWPTTTIAESSYLRGRIGWQGLKAAEFRHEGPYLVTGTDFRPGKIEWDTCYHVSEARFAEAEYIHLRNGDLLVTKDGTIGKIAYVEGCPEKAVLNSGIFVLRCRDGSYDHRYMFYVLQSDYFRRFLDDNLAGSTIQHLYQHVFEGFEFPLPEKTEQFKITKILSTVDRAIEQTEALIAKQQRIKTSLMQDLLTRGIDEHGNLRSEQTHQFKDSPLGRIPVDWEVKELNDLVDEPITYGIVQAGPHIENGIPYIRTGDMAGEIIQVSQLLRTSPKIAKSYKRSSIYPGDIIFALRATVGKVLTVNEELSGANLTQGTAKISPRDSVDSIFLLWAMRTSQVQNAIRLEQKGTTFMEITLGDLRRIKLAFPKEKYEQFVIGEQLKLHERLRRDSLEQKRKLQSIKTALMQDLLTGKRRVTKL